MFSCQQFHTIFSDQALLMEMQQFGDAMGEALEAEKMSHIQHFMESNLTNPGNSFNFSSKCPAWRGVAISKCPQWLSGGIECNQELTAEDGLAICAEWSANAHDNECYRATVAAGVDEPFRATCSSGTGLVCHMRVCLQAHTLTHHRHDPKSRIHWREMPGLEGFRDDVWRRVRTFSC